MNLLDNFKRFLKEAKASTAIEFAIVFPLYVFFLIAFIEFGIMMYGNALLDSTLTRASRRAMVGCIKGECDNENLVNNILAEIDEASFGFISNDDTALGGKLKVKIAPIDTNVALVIDGTVILGDGGDVVSYCLEYDWNDLLPITPSTFIPGLPKGTITFKTCTVVRNEEYGAYQR